MPTIAAPDHDVFYSRFNRVLAVVIWVVAGLAAATLFLAPSGIHLLYLIPAALVSLFAWEVLWRPLVDVSDDAIVLRNALRGITIPWPALVHIDTKFALTLHTPGHKYSAWAAPAPGRAASYRAGKTAPSRKGKSDDSSIGVRPGDLMGTESGQAAHLVRVRWARLQRDNRIEPGIAGRTSVAISWHWPEIIGLAILAVGSVVAVALV